MPYNTVNAACTHPKAIRFGGRRRQCISCKKTWTVRAKKRGAKPRKHRVTDLAKTFVEKLTLVQQSRRTKISAKGLSKRHAHTLEILTEQPWPHSIPDGNLILVMDAVWFTFSGERYRSGGVRS